MSDLENKHIGIDSPVEEEFWHLGTDGEGASGPFKSMEEAQADALTFLHDERWRVPTVKIVKVVATSETFTTHQTVWK